MVADLSRPSLAKRSLALLTVTVLSLPMVPIAIAFGAFVEAERVMCTVRNLRFTSTDTADTEQYIRPTSPVTGTSTSHTEESAA